MCRMTKSRIVSMTIYVNVMKRRGKISTAAGFRIQMYPFKFQELWIVIYIQGI